MSSLIQLLFMLTVGLTRSVLTEGNQSSTDHVEWWKTAVFYQIYPRSFKDSDGDGIGDIPGILSKLDYFKYLGIDCIWLSPVYPSPMRDFGYDLTDFEDIEPLFGTLDDFDDLVKAVHDNGLRIIVDFIPTYTSSDHHWFQRSVRREGKYTDYYIWHDGILLANGTRAPPSNWISIFGGPAWTWHAERQQFYYHTFLEGQPNLNHRDQEVNWEMEDILRFWLDRGVDGFRVDAVQVLFVAENLTADEPLSGHNVTSFEYDYLVPIYTEDQPEIVPTISSWYSVLNDYYKKDGKVRYMVLETYGNATSREPLYATGGTPFNFDLHHIDGETSGFQVADIVMAEYNSLPSGAWPNFVLGNHDQRRVSHRMGAEYVDVYNLLLLTLWGTPTTYYGEELGMLEGNISWKETVDPWGLRIGPERYQEYSRDPERTPMQWGSGFQAGFTTGNTTWLPLAQNYTYYNVKTEQESAELSSLKFYKFLCQIRRRPAFQSANFKLAAVDDDVISYIREGAGERYLVALNVGRKRATNDYTIHTVDPHAIIVALTPGLQGLSVNQTISLSNLELSPGAGVVLQIVSTDRRLNIIG